MIEAILASAWSSQAWVDESMISPFGLDLVANVSEGTDRIDEHLESMA